MKPIKKIALLHSLCSIGKASITNMIPVLSVMGIEACPIPTTVLSTHTGGYGAPAKEIISPEYIKNCADHYQQNNIEFDAIFVGYLGSGEMLYAARYFIEKFPKATKILDPIMGDHGKLYANVSENYIQSFRELLPLMDIVLPNLTEACLLAEQPYFENISLESINQICEYFHKYNIQHVIITSSSSNIEKLGIIYSNQNRVNLFEFDAQARDFHGTGDVFDGVLIASWLQDKEMQKAIKKAHDFVSACIEESSKFDYPIREGLLIESKLSMLV